MASIRFSIFNRWRSHLAAHVLLCTSALMASPMFPELEFGPNVIDRLANPGTQLEAVHEIVLALEESHEKSDWKKRSMDTFADYHQNIRLTRCPQPGDADPLYLLTFEPNFPVIWAHRDSALQHHRMLYPETDREREALIRLAGRDTEAEESTETFWEPPIELLEPRGLIFLNSNGRMVHPFMGNDYIDGGILHDVNGNGVLERIEAVNMGVYDRRQDEPNMRVQLLEVYSVELSPRPLFRLILNWHSYELDSSVRWDWELKDIDANNIYEITIGPPTEDGIEVMAVFRWDADKQKYSGPQGGLDQRFIALDLNTEPWEQLRAIKEAGGLSYAPVPTASAKEIFFSFEPYIHKSLAELGHAELFEFMWGGKKEHPPAPPPAGEHPRKGEQRQRKFEVPRDLFELQPQAAALALAEGRTSTRAGSMVRANTLVAHPHPVRPENTGSTTP